MKPFVCWYRLPKSDGESILSFPPNQEKEQICECFEKIREQNPASGFCSCWITSRLTSVSTRASALTNLGIDLVFLPVGSPDLNPIEPVWNSLKWESSPLIDNGEDEYRRRLDELFDQLTEKLSSAASRIDNHLSGFLNKIR